MIHAGEPEQRLEIPLVVPPGAGVGVPHRELRDKGLPCRRPYVNTS